MNLIKTIIIGLGLLSASVASSQSYRGGVDVGFATGAAGPHNNQTETSVTSRFETSVINGLQFNDWLYAGLGVGIQVWQVTHDVSMPVFVSLEGILNRGAISPFAEIRSGYAFALNEIDTYRLGKDGAYFNLSIGFKWKHNDNNTIKFSTGYLFQVGDITRSELNPLRIRWRMHSLVARVGLEF